MTSRTEPKRCEICGETRHTHLRPAIVVRPPVAAKIQQEHPGWSDASWICVNDLQLYRHYYVESLLEAEKGELDELEEEVVRSLEEHELLARNPDEEFETSLTLGQRIADRIASFGGSWGFIGIFAGVMVVWMAVNTWLLATRAFDPFPFILLNLALSCLAAIQAPVIMMSQNRQEDRDRARGMHEYQINLKAELEIRHLHQKVDHLLTHQWQRLVEIQEIQMELINEMRSRR